jgi:hypothetical protein
MIRFVFNAEDFVSAEIQHQQYRYLKNSLQDINIKHEYSNKSDETNQTPTN